MATFNAGDIVRLKSGGPEMTVKTVPSAGSVIYSCQWFAGKKLEVGTFASASLEAVPPKLSSPSL